MYFCKNKIWYMKKLFSKSHNNFTFQDIDKLKSVFSQGYHVISVKNEKNNFVFTVSKPCFLKNSDPSSPMT